MRVILTRGIFRLKNNTNIHFNLTNHHHTLTWLQFQTIHMTYMVSVLCYIILNTERAIGGSTVFTGHLLWTGQHFLLPDASTSKFTVCFTIYTPYGLFGIEAKSIYDNDLLSTFLWVFICLLLCTGS